MNILDRHQAPCGCSFDALGYLASSCAEHKDLPFEAAPPDAQEGGEMEAAAEKGYDEEILIRAGDFASGIPCSLDAGDLHDFAYRETRELREQNEWLEAELARQETELREYKQMVESAQQIKWSRATDITKITSNSWCPVKGGVYVGEARGGDRFFTSPLDAYRALARYPARKDGGGDEK